MKSSSTSHALFDTIFLSCLLVNHGFSSRRHLTYERMGQSLARPVYTKRHVGSLAVVPLHKQIHGITLAHHDCLKLWQLALNLTVQPLQLAVGLRVSDACQNLFYSKLDQLFLKDRCPLLLYLRGVGVELGSAASYWGCMFAVVFYGLLKYGQRVFGSIATLEKICNRFWILENVRFTVNVDTRILQKV